MPRIPVLDEASMQAAESQIPQLAHRAGLAAHRRAVSSHATILVMKTPSGDLVARQTSGQVVVLKALPAATPVLTGTVLKRAAKHASRPADGEAAVASAQPRLRVFAGPNGSGKSTIHEILKPEWIGVYVNADEIEKQLRGTGALDLNPFELTEPAEALQRRISGHLAASELLAKHGLLQVAQAVAVTTNRRLHLPLELANSYVAAVLADAIRRALLAQGSTFTFETVMSSRDKIDFMREARALGYRTCLYFVATDDPEINISRVQLRVSQGGHDVPEDLIRSRYVRSIGLLDDACAAAHRAYIFDNSGQAHQCIAEVIDGTAMIIQVDALPAWFTGTALWRSFIAGDDLPANESSEGWLTTR